MYKIFNFLIVSFAVVLVLFSLATFLIIQRHLFKLNFSFTPKGLNLYLKEFSDYSTLFGATITLIVAYFGIKRLEAAEISNRDKVKFDRYNDWKIVTDTRIQEIENLNTRFRREFYTIRFNLFSELYQNDLSIIDKKYLKFIFNKYFKNHIIFFEEMTDKSLRMGNIYRVMELHFQEICIGLLIKVL